MTEQTVEQTAHDLERLAEVLESGWCQGAYARDELGKVAHLDSENAVSFCLEGGLSKALGDIPLIVIAREALAESLEIESDELMDWNDEEGRTQKEVVCLCLDTAKRLRNGRLGSTPLRS